MSLYNGLVGSQPMTTSTAGYYVDQYGNQVPIGTYPSTPQQDWRDSQIVNLNMIIAAKETALREAYCEIGRLHEQIRGMQAFDKWSEGITTKKAQP